MYPQRVSWVRSWGPAGRAGGWAAVRTFWTGRTLGIGALAAAEIVALSYLERQPHLATLRALAWSRGLVLRLLVGQALALGLAGGSGGALIVGAAGRILEAPVQVTLAAASSSLMIALLATGLAAIVPLALAYRLPAAAALHNE